jgi:hypothetical protein
MTITLATTLAKLPIAKLSETIEAHVRPLIGQLPDQRLGAVVVRIILSILGSQTPLVTGMAPTNSKADGESWSIAKRIYRFLYNRRLKTASLYQGLYAIRQSVVERENPSYLVVAVDPVNFEKPYAEAIEGVLQAADETLARVGLAGIGNVAAPILHCGWAILSSTRVATTSSRSIIPCRTSYPLSLSRLCNPLYQVVLNTVRF